MCKMLIMSGIKDETKDNAWAFVKEMSRQMSSPHSPENDGIGYAAIDNEGKLFGERWFNNKEAFQHQATYGSEMNNELMKKFKILNMKPIYNKFGTYNENFRSITLHSRAATNAKELKNNHPFVEGHTSVIHNGVIYNDEKFTKKTSTCDSEVILHEYIRHNIANKIFKVKKMVSRLEGYYAMGIFSKMQDGTVILDILKDNTAKLEAYYIKELETIVFATPRFHGSTVEDACKTLGFTVVSKYEVKPNKLQRLNAMTGETIGFEGFKSKDFTRKSTTTNITTYKGDNYYRSYGSHDGMYGNSYDSRHEFEKDEAFKKAFESAHNNSNNVIDIKAKQVEDSHSKDKHDRAIIEKEFEKELEKIIIDGGNSLMTEAEIDELQKKFLPQVIGELVKETSNFNDDGDIQWYMDESFTWHKKG